MQKLREPIGEVQFYIVKDGIYRYINILMRWGYKEDIFNNNLQIKYKPIISIFEDKRFFKSPNNLPNVIEKDKNSISTILDKILNENDFSESRVKSEEDYLIENLLPLVASYNHKLYSNYVVKFLLKPFIFTNHFYVNNKNFTLNIFNEENRKKIAKFIMDNRDELIEYDEKEVESLVIINKVTEILIFNGDKNQIIEWIKFLVEKRDFSTILMNSVAPALHNLTTQKVKKFLEDNADKNEKYIDYLYSIEPSNEIITNWAIEKFKNIDTNKDRIELYKEIIVNCSPSKYFDYLKMI